MTDTEERAGELLEAWLRGLNQSRGIVSRDDIIAVYSAAVRQAEWEARRDPA